MITRSAGSNIGPFQEGLRRRARICSRPPYNEAPRKPHHHVEKENPSQGSKFLTLKCKNNSAQIRESKTKKKVKKKDIFDEKFSAASCFVRVASLLDASMRTLASHFYFRMRKRN